MQVLLYMEETISEYYEQVKGKDRDIFSILELSLDIYRHCPICGGANCAQFIGYYTRQAIDENGQFYKEFPIARFLCNRKGKDILVTDKTFSLLPFQLSPYHKYSIPFIVKILKLRHIQGRSIYEILDDLSRLPAATVPTSGSQICGFDKVIQEAIEKVFARGYYPELEEKIHQNSSLGQIKSFLEFSEGFECVKVNTVLKGPCALGYDFYLSDGGYYKNAWFLFGKPSQFRGG